MHERMVVTPSECWISRMHGIEKKGENNVVHPRRRESKTQDHMKAGQKYVCSRGK